MTPKIVIERRQKMLDLLIENPMSILDLKQVMSESGVCRNTVFRDLRYMLASHMVNKRYCHWNGQKNAKWIYYVDNEELDNMDDEFTLLERIIELLKDGQTISYLTVGVNPEVSVYMQVKRLRDKGWNIGERKVDASVGRYKEFYLITK